MNNQLKKAIQLREKGLLKESNSILVTLLNTSEENAYINYQVASSFDLLGDEEAAVRYYQTAIKLGLPEKELWNAYLGLGSTYRNLGKYDLSEKVFKKAMKQFPNNNALKIFYSITLYNLERYEESVAILLNTISLTSSDKNINDYKNALQYYSKRLNKINNQ